MTVICCCALVRFAHQGFSKRLCELYSTPSWRWRFACYPLKASPTSQNTPLHWCPSTAPLTRAALHPEKFRIVLGLPDLTARYRAALRSPGSGKWPFGPVAPARYRIAVPAVSSSPSRRVHTPNPCVHAPPCLAPGHPGVTFPVVDLPDKSICTLPYIERPPLTLSQDGEAEGS